MNANQTTLRLHKGLVLPLVVVMILATSCASTRQPSASPTPSGFDGTASQPTLTSRVSQSTTPARPTEVAPVHPGTLAFVSVSLGVTDDIYVIQTDGTGLKQLTETHASAEDPSWSPDGSKIAYDTYPEGPDEANQQYNVWVMNADGSEKKQLTHGPLGGTFPSWSPHGTRFAYTNWSYPPAERGPAQIYVMGADGSNPRRVTNGPANDIVPQWAPDGRIFFLRKERGWDSFWGDVFAVNPDGTGLVRLTTMEHVGGFAPSPDGTKIAIHDMGQHRILVLPVSASGTPITLLDWDFGYTFVQMAWSPDGEALALARLAAVSKQGFELHIVNADGSGLTTVPNAEAVMSVAWRPR